MSSSLVGRSHRLASPLELPGRRFSIVARTCFVALVISLIALGSRDASADLVLTANSAGSQQSTVAGVTTQNFDSFATGHYLSLNIGIGTLTSDNMAIVAANQYGGAGSTGNYFSIGAQSGGTTATLNLNSPQAYFGIWWSAADALNKISFLSGGQTVASFNSAAALGSLDSSYKGNPNNTSQDAGEKFAYLNFIGTNGTTFDQIVFSNLNTSTGFESDNWSVTPDSVPDPYPGNGINGIVPEPGSLALMTIGAAGMCGVFWRKKMTQAS